MGKTTTRERVKADACSLPDILRETADRVQRDGAAPKAALGKLLAGKAPQEAQALLRSYGLELAGRFVRAPLETQLERHLEDAPLLPMRAIGDFVQGASKRAAALAARELVAQGRARLVVRSTELFLASKGVAGLSEPELERFDVALVAAVSAMKRAKKLGATLLRADLDEVFQRVKAPAAAVVVNVSSEADFRAPSAVEISRAILAHRENSGLTWVPKLVRELGGPQARDVVHEELLRGARAARYELRPDSGMGRLGPEDSSLCLAGPQGSALSWVRCLEEVS